MFGARTLVRKRECSSGQPALKSLTFWVATWSTQHLVLPSPRAQEEEEQTEQLGNSTESWGEEGNFPHRVH